jgi:hypothetical protein
MRDARSRNPVPTILIRQFHKIRDAINLAWGEGRIGKGATNWPIT